MKERESWREIIVIERERKIGSSFPNLLRALSEKERECVSEGGVRISGLIFNEC